MIISKEPCERLLEKNNNYFKYARFSVIIMVAVILANIYCISEVAVREAGRRKEGVRQKEKLTHSASQFNFVVLPPQG